MLVWKRNSNKSMLNTYYKKVIKNRAVQTAVSPIESDTMTKNTSSKNKYKNVVISRKPSFVLLTNTTKESPKINITGT